MVRFRKALDTPILKFQCPKFGKLGQQFKHPFDHAKKLLINQYPKCLVLHNVVRIRPTWTRNNGSLASPIKIPMRRHFAWQSDLVDMLVQFVKLTSGFIFIKFQKKIIFQICFITWSSNRKSSYRKTKIVQN